MIRRTLYNMLPLRSFLNKPVTCATPSLTQAPVRSFWSSILKMAATAGKDVGLSQESAARISTMRGLLESTLKVEHVSIEDVSGGCGAFFKVTVVSDAFVGKPMLARHRLVQGVLKNDIKDMHGITLNTLTVDQFKAGQQ